MSLLRILLMILSLILVGCSSSKSKNGMPEELEGISNNDFKAKKSIKYKQYTDYFGNFKGEITSGIDRETIQRIPVRSLSQIDEGLDPIGYAVGLCYQGEFDKAFNFFDQIYANFKKNPSYWNQVGTCYYLKGEFKKAGLYYNKARELKKNYAPAINNLGVLYLKYGEDQKAMEAFKKASRLNKFSLTPVFNLGQLYLQFGLIKKAKHIFSSLHKKNSNDIDVINSFAASELFLGNFQKSYNLYSKIPEKYLSRADISLNYAVVLKQLNRTDEAANIYDEIDFGSARSLKSYYYKVGRFLGVRK